MVQYRRNHIPGGCYFFTVTLRDRRSTLLVDHIDLLRSAFRQVRQDYPFTIDAIVIMPDHLHAIWTLSPGDVEYSDRWRRIKGLFTRALIRRGHAAHRNAKGERRIWQRRYWEHTITDDLDLRRHIEYIHYNPVKHGFVVRPADWRYSSFHHYVEAGKYSFDWGAEKLDFDGVGNE